MRILIGVILCFWVSSFNLRGGLSLVYAQENPPDKIPEEAPTDQTTNDQTPSTEEGSVNTEEAETAPDSGKSPALAATFALLFPGAGHYYLGNGHIGNGVWFSASVPTLIGGGFLVDQLTDSSKIGQHLMTSIGLNLHFYQIFDAYRDARIQNNNRGYENPIDTHDYTDLLIAPLNPEVMFRWQTIVPTVAMVAGLVALRTNVNEWGPPPGSSRREDNLFGESVDPYTALTVGSLAYFIEYTHVGIGEEALFRGVVQSGLTEWWGPYWAIPSQAMIFSLYHFYNYGTDIGMYMTAFLAGLVFGWQYQATQDLRVSVATHAWLDFSLALTNYIMDPKNNPLGLQVQFFF